MAKYILELFLDGYETEEEMKAACEEFIDEQLNFAASSVDLTPIDDEELILINRKEFSSIRNDRAGDFSVPCKEFDEYRKV